MRRELETELVGRVLALLEAKSTHMADDATRSLAKPYHDAATLDRERRKVFGEHPLIVAHESELAREGDYRTHDASGIPLLLVRTSEGLKAFVNVCRHRGTRLECTESGSRKKAFVCPYHGWTYDLRGDLIHVPHEEGFPRLKREAMGLMEVPVTTAFGFVWVLLKQGVKIDPLTYLGALARDFEDLGLGSHAVYRPTTFVKKLNWKLAIDIFLEAYHVKRTHKDSIYPVFFDNVGLFDAFAPHLRNVFPKRSIQELRGVPESAWDLRKHANLLYTIFPNTLMLVQPDHVGVFHVFPRTLDESTLLSYTLVPESPKDEKATAYWDKNIQILHEAIGEDFTMGESIQQGLAAGVNEHFCFGRFEQALGAFHAAIDAALERTP